MKPKRDVIAAGVGLLPSIKNEIHVRKTFRYAITLSTAAYTWKISSNNLQNLLVSSLSSTTATTIFGSVRLRKVSLYAQSSTANNVTLYSTFPALPALDGIGGPQDRVERSGIGLTSAVHIHHVPKEGSVQSMWVGNPANANIYYEFGVTQASSASISLLVDLDVEFTLQNNISVAGAIPVSTITFGSGMTPGWIYAPSPFTNPGTASSPLTGIVQGWVAPP